MSPGQTIRLYYIALLILWLPSRGKLMQDLKLYRGKYDKFSNPYHSECSQESSFGGSNYCRKYHAECLRPDCSYCSCNQGGNNTYLPRRQMCVTDAEIVYESGCNRFQGSPLLQNINPETCSNDDCFNKAISAANFPHNTNCVIKWKKSQYMGNKGSWKSVRGKIFFSKKRAGQSSHRRKPILKGLNPSGLRMLSSSLLKLAITCRGKVDKIPTKKKLCILLKFEAIQQAPSNRRSSSTKKSSNSKLNCGSSSSKVIPITISIVVLVVILAVVFGFCMLYRRRKRAQEQASSEDEGNTLENSPKSIYDDLSQLYETIREDHGQIGIDRTKQRLGYSTDAYHYIDREDKTVTEESSTHSIGMYDYIDNEAKNVPNLASNDSEYSYATNRDVARSFGTKEFPGMPSKTVYQTLEGPDVGHDQIELNEEVPSGAPTCSKSTDHQSTMPVYQTLENSDTVKRNSNSNDDNCISLEPTEKSNTRSSNPVYHVLDT